MKYKPCAPRHCLAVRGRAGLVKPLGGRGPEGLTTGGHAALSYFVLPTR